MGLGSREADIHDRQLDLLYVYFVDRSADQAAPKVEW